MKIIGLGYKAGSGKDWVAQNIYKPMGYLLIGFAWPLKLEALDAGFTVEEVFIDKPSHVRRWLQNRGYQARLKDPEHWVKKLDRLIGVLHHEGGHDKFVIKDVRFENEMGYVRSKGGVLVKLTHGDRPYPLAGTDAALHESETALDAVPDSAWDAVIENGTDVTPFKMKVRLARSGVLDGPKVDSLQLSLI